MEEEREAVRLRGVLAERDRSIDVLRGLLAEKQNPGQETKQGGETTSPQKSKIDYSKMQYPVLKRLEKAPSRLRKASAEKTTVYLPVFTFS